MQCYLCENCPFLDSNIPSDLHELHVTVSLPCDLNLLRQIAEHNGWKVVYLDLNVAHDAMITACFRGDPKDAHQLALRITDILNKDGFRVIRRKIVTTLNNTMSRLAVKHNYFETHFAFHVDDDFDNMLLRTLVGSCGHVSKNMFKNDTLMVTYRSYNCSRADHLSIVHEAQSNFDTHQFKVKKVINEYCWYDDNLAHDNEWVNS